MNKKIRLFFRSVKEVFSACPNYNIALALCLFVVGIMPALNVFATGQLVSIFENTSSTNSIVFIITIWGISLLLPTLLNPFISYLQSHINQLVTNKIITQLMKKNASFHGLQAYEDVDIQDAVAVLKNQSKFRPTNFSVNLVTIVRELITVTALSFMLFAIKWWIPFVILLAAIPLSYINFKVASFSWQALMITGKQSRLMDYFSSVTFSKEAQKDIHLFRAYPLIIDKYSEAFQSVYSELKKAQFNIFIKPIPFQLISIFVIGLVLFSLYEQNKAATITASSIVVLLQSIVILNNRLDGLIQHSALLYEILDYFKKYFSFLDYSDNIKNGELAIDKIQTIEFVNVSFKYPKSENYILYNLNFTANLGESIAIVGHNGAGKSTLVYLICRFWDVSKGQILINGQDIRLYDVLMLRKCIGAVFQDFFRFNLTINENISFNKTAAFNDNKIQAELGLRADVSLDTLVGKSFGGIEFSGGQWQRLAILRGLNAKTSMILLDEPTSAIDPKSEAKLYEDFKLLSKGKLSVMITHRLGSINGVDRVLVIDKGVLVQDGTPEALKRDDGVFKELWGLQSGLYTNNDTTL